MKKMVAEVSQADKKPCVEISKADNILQRILIYSNTAATQYLAAASSFAEPQQRFC
jgi:hypothetical protein